MLSKFDRRIDNVPDEWKSPLTGVIDTFDSVCVYLREIQECVEDEDEALGRADLNIALELTKLVLERKDRAEDEEQRIEESI